MEGKLKVYYDAEFTGLHRGTSLISIGLVSETGSTFYAEFTDYDKSQVNDWLQEHVIDNLLFNDKEKIVMLHPTGFDENEKVSVSMKGQSAEIKDFLERWFKHELALTKETENECDQIQIYCDCYAYDWMLFNDLMCEDGLALNLPDYLYYIPVDLSTYLQMRNIDPDINREELIHKLFPDYDLEDDILSKEPFNSNEHKEDAKHNSLWDALICKLAFEKLRSMTDGEREHPLDLSLKPAHDPNLYERGILEHVSLDPKEYLVQYKIIDNSEGKTYEISGFGIGTRKPVSRLVGIIFISIITLNLIKVSIPDMLVEKLGNARDDENPFEKIRNEYGDNLV